MFHTKKVFAFKMPRTNWVLKLLPLHLLLIILTKVSFAQCNFSIANLPDTLNICKNTSVAVSPSILVTGGSPSYIDTSWTPSTGLSNANILNPIINAGTSSTNYILTVAGVTPNNLIANGDFSLGNTIFTSDYVYGTGGPFGLLSNAGEYAISTNPQLTHVNFASFGDHTTGTGNMMVVNGSSTPNVNIWCQTIAVIPNTDYDFSAWGATCVASSPAILQFSINGTLIGAPLALPLTTAIWVPFHATWNSGSNTSITICITDQATASSGNDFAIDDISFRQICYVSDSVFAQVTNLTPGIQSNIFLGCEKDSVQFTANAGIGNQPASYSWEFGDGAVSTSQNPLHTYSTQGTYTVKLITELNGCKDSTFTTINTLHPMNADFSIPDSACTNVQIQAIDLSTATGAITTDWFWGDGQQTQTNTHTYISPGKYTIKLFITDGLGCHDSSSALIDIIEPPYLSLPSDTMLCEGDAILLNAISNSSNIGWQDGTSGISYQVTQTGEYIATASNYCGSAADTVNVAPKECQCLVFIPTAFTPNGDARNDSFKPLFNNCDVSNYSLLIYNRWGQLIFQSSDKYTSWDGTYKGIKQDLGTYFYLLQYHSPYSGLKYKKGEVLLVR